MMEQQLAGTGWAVLCAQKLRCAVIKSQTGAVPTRSSDAPPKLAKLDLLKISMGMKKGKKGTIFTIRA